MIQRRQFLIGGGAAAVALGAGGLAGVARANNPDWVPRYKSRPWTTTVCTASPGSIRVSWT